MRNAGLDLTQKEDYAQKQFSTDDSPQPQLQLNPHSISPYPSTSTSSSLSSSPQSTETKSTDHVPPVVGDVRDPNLNQFLPLFQSTKLVDDNGIVLSLTDPFPDCGDFLHAIKLSEGNPLHPHITSTDYVGQ